MKKANLLLILLLSFFFAGCAQPLSEEELAKTEDYCPLSGKEIQDFCGVSLKEVKFPEDYANYSIRSSGIVTKQCLYVIQDEPEYYEISINTLLIKNITIDSLRELYVNHQDVDFADGATYLVPYAGNYDDNPTLIFQNGDMVHGISVYREKPSLLGKGKCETKEGVMLLAEKYMEELNRFGYPE